MPYLYISAKLAIPYKFPATRVFWPIFGVICCLNHENPSRVAEVRRILVPMKSILDHTRWQSRFAREFDLFWTKICLTSAILNDLNFILLQILVRIFCFLRNSNLSKIVEVRRSLVQKRSNFLLLLCNLLCHLVWSKIDFLGTKIRLTSAILDGFSWFKWHITPNIGQNILVAWNVYGIANLIGIYK